MGFGKSDVEEVVKEVEETKEEVEEKGKEKEEEEVSSSSSSSSPSPSSSASPSPSLSSIYYNKFGAYFHPSSVIPFLDFLQSRFFNPNADQEKGKGSEEGESKEEDEEDKRRREDVEVAGVLRRARTHHLSLPNSSYLRSDFFEAVSFSLGNRMKAEEIKDKAVEWFSKNKDFLIDGKAISTFTTNWDNFLTQIKTDLPISPLWLPAIADVTNHCLLVVTPIEADQYLMNIEPVGGGEGVISLAHWGFNCWAPLETLPAKGRYPPHGKEGAILNKAQELLQSLNKLSSHQMNDLEISAGLKSKLESWILTRSDPKYGCLTETFTFGYGGDHALGQNTTSNYTVPKLLDITDEELTNGDINKEPMVAVAGGEHHSMFVRQDGSLFSAGSNASGQLAISGTNPHKVTINTELSDMTVKHVACGGSHTLVATACNGLYAFGYGKYGQRGDGTYDKKVTKNTLLDFPKRNEEVVGLAAGENFSACVLSNGNLYTFGDNSSGQLGLGRSVSYTNKPTLVEKLEGRVKKVACGRYHMLATTFDGNTYAWGFAKEGRLGARFEEGYLYEPEIIKGLCGLSIVCLAAGESHSVAVDSSGLVWAWGRGNEFQLGLGDSYSRFSPRVVPGIPFATKATCAKNSTYILCGGGDVYSCGDSSYGQLGHGDFKPKEVPTKIKHFDKNVTAIGAGVYHCVVVAKKYTKGVDQGLKELERKTEQPVKGVHVVYKPEGEVKGDIVFVGAALQTWVSGDGSLWPRDWLAKDLPNFRIIIVETGTIEKETWQSYVKNIKNPAASWCHLLREDPISLGQSHRPIIWVGHSVAGLVVKEILLEAENHASGLFTASRLAMFYSTPHHKEKHLRYCLRLATRTTINAPNNADLAVLGATAEQFGKFQHIFTLSLGEKEKIDASYVRIMEKFDTSDATTAYKGAHHKFVAVRGNHYTVSRPPSPLSESYKLCLEEILLRTSV